MSEVKVNKISPRTDCGTVTLGDSGDSFVIPAGATITNNGTQTGFGRTGAVDWQTTPKTATFTAVSGEGYFINQSSAITANLPAGSPGAIVAFSDYARNFATYNLTVSPNGSEKIGGVAANATLNVNGQAATFVYVDSTKGWVNVQNAEDTETGTAPAYIAATGGSISTVCTNFKVHTFTGPGTFEITAGAGPLSKLDYLIVGGGAGGGGGEPGYWTGGGGGAGGFRESKTSSVSGCWSASPLVAACGSLGPFTPGPISVTVGGGGAGGTSCNPACNATVGGGGNASVFSTITSAGGGGGGKSTGDTSGTKPDRNGLPGGSGGGSGGGAGAPAGTGNTPPVSPPQGNNGGVGATPSSGVGGGGGGAGAVGQPFPGSAGGAGVASSITSSPVTRAAGGNGTAGGAGSANTGDGGDANPCGSNASAGGSGVVIIRYRFQA